ncbi:MAG TPA: phosphatidylserine decarboxylase [Gammaproteobacteria bacterium]|nr:phosphatidylserine decarboxylase [Gammaproteobacteria bacterium]
MPPNTDHSATLLDYLKAWPTYLLPHHALSRIMHAITRSEIRWWKTLFTRWFVRHFKVDMSLAADPRLEHYPCFNAFFTRALRADARPIVADDTLLACPVDGAVSQLGDIKNGRIFQAKGRDYTLLELLGHDEQQAAPFMDGKFATLYLSPRDYHRIHLPFDGRLTAMCHIPGRLFSVSPATARAVPRLFARNERVVTYFDTDLGPMALVLVGAIFVASIETVWAGEVTPPAGKTVRHWTYDPAEPAHQFCKGDEIARFNMGSTVIMLHPADSIQWLENIHPADKVQMGQAIARRI